MDHLSLEETVYAIQKTASHNLEPTVTEIKEKNIGTTKGNETYRKSKNSELICQIGKRMSYLLRHGSCNERIQMDDQVYVSITALLQWLNKDLSHNLNIDDIIWIVDNNNKVRFSNDAVRGVKAKYGHSLELPEMIMKEYRDDGIENKRYIVHKKNIKYLPKILNEGLSKMERNHAHLCKQIGETCIRRKKRANIAVHIDKQAARHDGLKFFSAPNDVIMCAGDENGCIPIKYFKEIKNIQTGEQVEFKEYIPKKITQNKSLSPLAQNFIPVRTEESEPNNIKRRTNKDQPMVPKQYCGQAYDNKPAWKDLELEFKDYQAEEKKK